MSEFKVGDRVLYKGYEGTIISQKGRLYAVRFDNAGVYLYADQIEPLKTTKGCMYCKHGEPLNDTANSDLTVNIYQDGGEHILGCDYDNGESATDCTGTVIHYCPMCGRKLEVAE